MHPSRVEAGAAAATRSGCGQSWSPAAQSASPGVYCCSRSVQRRSLPLQAFTAALGVSSGAVCLSRRLLLLSECPAAQSASPGVYWAATARCAGRTEPAGRAVPDPRQPVYPRPPQVTWGSYRGRASCGQSTRRRPLRVGRWARRGQAPARRYCSPRTAPVAPKIGAAGQCCGPGGTRPGYLCSAGLRVSCPVTATRHDGCSPVTAVRGGLGSPAVAGGSLSAVSVGVCPVLRVSVRAVAVVRDVTRWPPESAADRLTAAGSGAGWQL